VVSQPRHGRDVLFALPIPMMRGKRDRYLLGGPSLVDYWGRKYVPVKRSVCATFSCIRGLCCVCNAPSEFIQYLLAAPSGTVYIYG
jgi:hypothetical protein